MLNKTKKDIEFIIENDVALSYKKKISTTLTIVNVVIIYYICIMDMLNYLHLISQSNLNLM